MARETAPAGTPSFGKGSKSRRMEETLGGLDAVREKAERELHEAQLRYIASGDVDLVALELASSLAEYKVDGDAAAAGVSVGGGGVEWAPPGRWSASPARTPRQQRYVAAAAAGSRSRAADSPRRSRVAVGDSLGSPPTNAAPRRQRWSPTSRVGLSTNGMDRNPRPRLDASDVDRLSEPLPRRRAVAAKTRAKVRTATAPAEPMTPSKPPPRVPRTTRAVEVRKAKTDEAAREVARSAKRAARIAERRHRERDELAKAGDMHRCAICGQFLAILGDFAFILAQFRRKMAQPEEDAGGRYVHQQSAAARDLWSHFDRFFVIIQGCGCRRSGRLRR